MSTIEALARRLVGHLGNAVTDQMVSELAICMAYGNGAVRLGDTGRGLLVLRPITEVMAPSNRPDFLPTVVGLAMPPLPPRKFVGSTAFVGHFFRSVGERGLGRQRPEGNYKPWAPVAHRSLSRVPIGGPYGPRRATSPDLADPRNHYDWYDLLEVSVGAVIYRVASDGHVIAFQRMIRNDDHDIWVQMSANGRRDYGDLHANITEAGLDLTTVSVDPRAPRPLAFDAGALVARREERRTS